MKRSQSGRKGHVTLHFLCKNKLSNEQLSDEYEMTEMIKQVSNSSMILANKGSSTEWADARRHFVLCLFHVFTLICMCV